MTARAGVLGWVARHHQAMIKIVEKLIETAPLWAMFWLSWRQTRTAHQQAQAEAIQKGAEGTVDDAPDAKRRKAWRAALIKETRSDLALFVFSIVWLIVAPLVHEAVTPRFVGGMFLAVFIGLISWMSAKRAADRLERTWRG